uniref:Uncharacterized protein n=1 Tax=Fagus sylvatica TaxID=28930 RepID=A0A2N9FCK3_FAGSY
MSHPVIPLRPTSHPTGTLCRKLDLRRPILTRIGLAPPLVEAATPPFEASQAPNIDRKPPSHCQLDFAKPVTTSCRPLSWISKHHSPLLASYRVTTTSPEALNLSRHHQTIDLIFSTEHRNSDWISPSTAKRDLTNLARSHRIWRDLTGSGRDLAGSGRDLAGFGEISLDVARFLPE